jgi:hypothetical protein
MRKIFFVTLIFSILSFSGWSETIEDLVERGGLYYKKFTDVPFTGDIEGRISGRLIDGKFNGLFVHYWDNGQLQTKGVYRDGKKEGKWVYFFRDGTVFETMTGIFKNDIKVSD